jgi:hypothetical protein
VLQPSLSDEIHATSATTAQFLTMTADDVSAAAGDTTDPTTLAKIPEDVHACDTAPGEAMDTGDADAEKSNLTKSHILVRFAGDGKPLNVAILLKAVPQWPFEIDPAMCLETNNADWKVIESMNDFPNKEVDFMKCFDPTHSRVGGSSAVIGIHLFSAVSIGLMKKNNTSFMQHLKSKKIGIKTSRRVENGGPRLRPPGFQSRQSSSRQSHHPNS